ncbi:hypothetical protein EXIGLDRAFT_836339 [Exidia glandulosa HHB12029]|uniref:Uncharacterized protein n=1 Tax=Exidia glandulosa HHB12029 TaxID=1314781 RepID=A0A166AJN4_EXIGL|nr:hypothetical protein EXIGLDRAFT_836339 [Exidia glandulosa HHB12029]
MRPYKCIWMSLLWRRTAVMVSFKSLLSILPLALYAHAALPAAGGPYIISAVAPGNVNSQFLNVLNSATAPGSTVVTTFLSAIPPRPNEVWFLTKHSDNGVFGFYQFQSGIGPQVNLGVGVVSGSPAVISPGSTVFNVSTTSSPGLFTMGVVNGFPNNFFNSGFVLTTQSSDNNAAQQARSFELAPGNTAQLWNIRLAPV